MRYIVGANIEGFNSLNIDSDEVNDIRQSEVIIALTKDSEKHYSKLYKAVRKLILNNNKVVIVFNGESTIWKPLAMLMALYKRYDVYELDSMDYLDSGYAAKLLERSATEEEVRTFLSSEIIAVSEIDEILVELKSLISEGDIDKAVELLASKADIIEASIGSLNYLRNMIDSLSDKSGEDEHKAEEVGQLVDELRKQIDELKAEIERTKTEAGKAKAEAEKAKVELETAKAAEAKAKKELEKYKAEVEEIKRKEKSLLDENSNLKNELASIKNKLHELEQQTTSGVPIIQVYAEVQTSLVKCKVKSIIYFKEITYVRYMNSLVTKLFEVISKIHKLRTKLVIYDNRSGFLQIYRPLMIVSSQEYVNNRDAVVNKMDKIVVVEANPSIIEDIIKADYDVVIVYDRMRNPNDVVVGNNVYKYWVINSVMEYNVLSSVYKIDKSHVIMGSTAYQESLFIPDLGEKYRGQTESARTLAYINAMHPYYNKSIIDLILERTNVLSIAQFRR